MSTLEAIHVGLPEHRPADGDGDAWFTAFVKQPVAGSVRLGPLGLAGDGVADTVNHGGPDKAVCVYPADHYPHWRADLGMPALPYGAFGENVTLAGLTEPVVCVGDVYRLGTAVVQVSQPRQPCWKLARRWGVFDLAARVVENGYSGWYFRVVEMGEIEVGQPLVLIERPQPDWSVRRAHEIMHHRRTDRAANRALAAVPELAANWRAALSRRA